MKILRDAKRLPGVKNNETITKILRIDLTSSKIESFEKILLNPLTGLNLSNFGCNGFPVTFHPTWITLISAVTTNPNAKKGTQTIKEAAREHHIEIVENKPLARMLYANVDIGQEIPPELYQAVAEILAMVYNMREK